MAEKEHTIPVQVGLGDVKVAPDQRYQNGIEYVINKFGKYLLPLAQVGLATVLTLEPRGFQPFNISDLEQLVSPPCAHIFHDSKETYPQALHDLVQ